MRKDLNLPNILTLTRVIAIPAVVLLLYFVKWYDWAWASQVATLVFAVACLTDVVDGHIARSQETITDLGRFLDPLADKLLIVSVLIMLVYLGWAPAWVAIIIVGRELSVTGIRAVAANKGTVISADRYGKIKTVTQSVAIGVLVWHVPFFGLDLNPLGLILLYIALAMTVFSGINYLLGFHRGRREQQPSAGEQ